MTDKDGTDSWLIDFDTVIRRGKIVTTVPVTPDDRLRLAKTLDVADIPVIVAKFVLSGDGRSQVALRGDVSATVVQSCVATLEPVEETIQVAVQRTFVKDGFLPETGDDADLDPFEDDHPDVVQDDAIDLFSVLTEVIALEMSPYPRSKNAPPASIDEAGEKGGLEPGEPSGPFAVLAELKNRLR